MYKIILLVLLLLPCTASAQDDSWKIFADSTVARLEITMLPSALNYMYQHPGSDSEHVAKIKFKNGSINETHDSVGIRLRGATSRNARKKSFKIEFNSFIKGRKFYNVTDINLNGEHNDPSIVRSKLVYDLSRQIGLNSPRCAYGEVYINGKYYGIYLLTEQIDDEWLKKNYANFSGNLWKCLYPGDLKYLGIDPNKYKTVMHDSITRAYELKTNKELDNYSKFSRLVNIVNNTATAILPDSLESVISIQDLLKYYALHVLVGGWDNYWSLMNNYYLYHDPTADLFHILPYDEDNTFGIDWFNVNWATANIYNWPKAVSGSRPLADRVLPIAQYKNLYTHFIDHIAKNAFNVPLWEGRLDSIKNMIAASASADSFRALDYGFTMTHFYNSYSYSFSNQHVKYGLKQFMLTRYNSLSSMYQWATCPPIAYNIWYTPVNPGPNDTVKVYVSAFDKDGISKASVLYTRNSGGAGTEYPLQFSPVPNTKKVEEADLYTAVIPPLGSSGSGSFTVYLKDATGSSQVYPRKRPVQVKISTVPANTIVLNEFLADNAGIAADPSGDFDDYVELYNPTTQPILLTGKYLTDNSTQLKKWRFTQPNVVLPAKSHVVIWCDEQGSQPGLHASFKLSKSGEYLALVDTNGVTILDSITFGPQTTNIAIGRDPDGTGNWLPMVPTPGLSNLTGVEHGQLEPGEFMLFPNFPNPFNPSTNITFSLPKQAKVQIRVFDTLGRDVATISNQQYLAGMHTVTFNASGLPSGVYLITLQSADVKKTIKAVLLR